MLTAKVNQTYPQTHERPPPREERGRASHGAWAEETPPGAGPVVRRPT